MGRDKKWCWRSFFWTGLGDLRVERQIIFSFILSKHLTDTDHLLAELGGLLHEGGPQHGHGHGQHSLDKGAAVLGVTVLTNEKKTLRSSYQSDASYLSQPIRSEYYLSAEAVSLEVGNTLGDGFISGHVVSSPSQWQLELESVDQ